MNKWIVGNILLLSLLTQGQEVAPRPIRGKPAGASLTDSLEMRVSKNLNTALLQFEFNPKDKISAESQSFDELVATQGAAAKPLKEVLTPSEADIFFQQVAKQKGIPFENIILSYCFDRAQAISRLLEINGYQSQKVFAEGLFIFDSALSHSGKVRWTSHVATTIQVLNDLGQAETQVIDPSLADHLLTLPEWFNILTQYTGMGCRGESGEVYGTGTEGCLFQVKSKYHYNGNDFSKDLVDWDKDNWKKSVDIMKLYYQAQILHGK